MQLPIRVSRMSEANMKSIVNAVEAFYMRNSRASVNECLFSCVMESIVSPVLVSELITMETAALVAALHCNVGTEVGKSFAVCCVIDISVHIIYLVFGVPGVVANGICDENYTIRHAAMHCCLSNTFASELVAWYVYMYVCVYI